MTKGLSLFEKRRRRNRTALRARAGTRPRLSVHRSGKHIYAQVIDDEAGRTVASASTLEKDVRDTSGANISAATDVGRRVAARLGHQTGEAHEGRHAGEHASLGVEPSG